jgi:hypothetical protein
MESSFLGQNNILARARITALGWGEFSTHKTGSMAGKRPNKVVSDYTASELSEFQSSFQPIAKNYRRRFRNSLLAFSVAIVGGIVLIPQSPWFLALWAAAIPCFGYAMLVKLTPLSCPACGFPLKSMPLRYCSICGTHFTKDPEGEEGPYCAHCKTIITSELSEKCYARHCTHCGIHLDPVGI